MNRIRRLRLVLCTLLCFVLCSCQTVLPANEKAQVEELLRAPKLSGDYGALQTALNDWLGESAQLKYPIQGELLSPFVLQDLDGDGQQDAAVLYTTAQTANVCVAILQRDDTGSWQVRQSVEGLAETVENVSLAQLQDTDSCQLVVGYTAAQNDHYLAVYSYQKGTLSTILEQQYEQYLVENITGGSSQDLILMSTQEDGSVNVVEISERGAVMASSTCHNQLCVQMGEVTLDNWETRPNQQFIICLPNRVSVELVVKE